MNLLKRNPLLDAEEVLAKEDSGLETAGLGIFFFPLTFSQHCSNLSSQQILLLGHVP